MYFSQRQKMAVGLYIGDQKNLLLNANSNITMYDTSLGA